MNLKDLLSKFRIVLLPNIVEKDILPKDVTTIIKFHPSTNVKTDYQLSFMSKDNVKVVGVLSITTRSTKLSLLKKRYISWTFPHYFGYPTKKITLNFSVGVSGQSHQILVQSNKAGFLRMTKISQEI